MANEKDTVKTEKEVSFSEMWYIFCKNILWEALIFVIVLIIGLGVALTSKDYYVARASVVIKASLNNAVDQEYSDTPLSQEQLILVCDVLKNEFFLDRVEMSTGKDVSAGNLTTSYNEDSLLINLKYRDVGVDLAKEKLTAIINEIAKFSRETNDEGLNKYFVANVEVVPITGEDNIVEPKVQTESDRMQIILISAAIGVAMVIVFIFCMMFFGDKVNSEAKLERITGKKNFIVVNEKKTSRRAKKDSQEQNDHEFLKFRLDKLSDTLIYLQDGDKNKVYQIQSAISKEGKTTVAINLALTLGLSDRKVLIIDCDFSHPSVHRAFKLSKQVGITDYFKGNINFDGMLKKTYNDNVDVITCGDHISDHTIFFTSDKFKSILSEAREKYDFVILDCAPVKALSDYINISPLVDATLLVVESDKVSTRELTYVVNELNSCKANIVGSVLNFSSSPMQKKYYYYYYNKENKMHQKKRIENKEKQ